VELLRELRAQGHTREKLALGSEFPQPQPKAQVRGRETQLEGDPRMCFFRFH